MKQTASFNPTATISAKIIRADGSVEELGVIARPKVSGKLIQKLRSAWPKK